MADAGEVKAKVTIEYDGSGLDQAKSDLASLADMAGSFGGDGGIGDAVAGMSDGFAGGTKGAKEFAEAVEGIGEPVKSGEAAVNDLSDALDEHQQAIESTGAAYEALQEPVGTAVSLLETMPEPLGQIAEQARTIVTPIANMSDNFAQLQDSISQATPMLPQFADSMHEVSAAFDPKQFGLDDFAENMAVFQDALENPYPFSMISQHLQETGQTWDDFTSSIGDDNTATLQGMAESANATHEYLGSVSNDFIASGKSANDAYQEYRAFTDQFNGVGGVAQDAGDSFDSLGNSVNSTGQSMNDLLATRAAMETQFGANKASLTMAPEESLGDILGGAMSDVSDAFMGMTQFLWPAMMVGQGVQMVQQIGQGIYDAAAIAEGPGAHGIGTFTGTVDALTQSAQRTGEAFSESFGQGVIPTLNALNYSMNQGGAGGIGQLGSFLGGSLSFLGNLGMIIGGAVSAPFGGGGMALTGLEGLVNQGASWLGFQQPFQGPGPQQQAQLNYQQQYAQIPQTVQKQTYQGQLNAATMIAEGLDNGPGGYLASQQSDYYAQQFLQQQQIAYNASHPDSAHQELMNYRQQQDTQAEQNAYASYQANPPTYSGDFWSAVGKGDWGSVGNILQQAAQGTILAPFVGAPSQAYTSDSTSVASYALGGGAGSGPMTSVAQQMGLPSFGTIEQDAAKNIGSFLGGAASLFSGGGLGNALSGISSFFHLNQTPSVASMGNISAAGFAGPTSFQMPHIDMGSIASNLGSQFSGIQLPHLDLGNIGSTIASNFSGISLPHLDLGNIGSSLAGAFGGIQLPHLDLGNIGSSLAGAFSGIQLPHLDLGNIGSSLAGAFSGIQLPPMPNLGSMIQGALGGMFSGITLPSIPDIGGMINGALGGMFSGITLPSIPNIGGMINGALGGMFSGITLPSIPDIGGMINGALGGMFGGVQMPQIPDVGGMINGALGGMFNAIHMPQIPPIGSMINSALSGMFSGIMIPGFASGVEGFGGGLAVVGENGPELLALPGGSSVYPMSTGGMSPISLGGSGGGGSAPQSISVVVQLDSAAIIQAMGLPLASAIRVGMGMRSF